MINDDEGNGISCLFLNKQYDCLPYLLCYKLNPNLFKESVAVV